MARYACTQQRTRARFDLHSQKMSRPAHCLRGDQNRDPESFLEGLGGHAQALDPFSIFSQIRLDTPGRDGFLCNLCLANQDTHIATVGVSVEIQSDPGVVGDMAHFGRRRLAKDQDGLTVPVKPDRPGCGVLCESTVVSQMMCSWRRCARKSCQTANGRAARLAHTASHSPLSQAARALAV